MLQFLPSKALAVKINLPRSTYNLKEPQCLPFLLALLACKWSEILDIRYERSRFTPQPYAYADQEW